MALYTTIKDQKVQVGDEVELTTLYTDADKTKKQLFSGVVIAIKNSGAGTSFTVRKMGTFAVGIERIFPTSWPLLEDVKVVKHNRVRRAKLYYMRNKTGKTAQET